MQEQNIQRLAMIIAANCMRESTLEACRKDGRLDDITMQAIQKETCDRIFTLLTYLLEKPADEYSQMMAGLVQHFPQGWPLPEFSPFIVNQQAQQPQPPTA